MHTDTRKSKKGIADPIMVIGQDRLGYSVASSLLVAGHEVLLLTADRQQAEQAIYEEIGLGYKTLQVQTEWPAVMTQELVVLVTADQLEVKADLIRRVEESASAKPIIATNMDAIHLEELQTHSRNPPNIFGLNWTYPVHRTFFAEIVANEVSHPDSLDALLYQAREGWGKDPYVVKSGFSTRARMLAALVREGLHLVEEGYASIESVDRACRNDAGYYLPFAGNFRYMDLMGTYAYGMVMEDLNRELSCMDTLPETLLEKKHSGAVGMDVGAGFYRYSPEEKVHWHTIFKEFSREIQQLIINYPHEPLDH